MALSQLSVTKQQRSRGSVVTPIISTFQLKKEGGGGGLSFVSQCGASSRCAASSFPRSAVSAVVPAADQLILPHTGAALVAGRVRGHVTTGDMRYADTETNQDAGNIE